MLSFGFRASSDFLPASPAKVICSPGTPNSNLYGYLNVICSEAPPLHENTPSGSLGAVSQKNFSYVGVGATGLTFSNTFGASIAI